MNSVLFSPLDVNIQIRGQYEDWGKVFFWKGNVNFVILASALSFWLAFLTFESWLIISSNAQYFFFWYIFNCNVNIRKIGLGIMKSNS